MFCNNGGPLDINLVTGALERGWPCFSSKGSEQQATFVVNCCHMEKPPGFSSKHLGVHPDYLAWFVEQQKHRDIITLLTASLKHAFVNQKRMISVIFVDYNGRLGSLAAAKCLAECFHRDQRLSLATVSIIHTKEEGACDEPELCKFWTRKWSTTNIAMMQVWSDWKNHQDGMPLIAT